MQIPSFGEKSKARLRLSGACSALGHWAAGPLGRSGVATATAFSVLSQDAEADGKKAQDPVLPEALKRMCLVLLSASYPAACLGGNFTALWKPLEPSPLALALFPSLLRVPFVRAEGNCIRQF